MIRLLKETVWVEAYQGCGSLAGAREHNGKLYIPVVKERLQYKQLGAFCGEYRREWLDVPTDIQEQPFPPPDA